MKLIQYRKRANKLNLRRRHSALNSKECTISKKLRHHGILCLIKARFTVNMDQIVKNAFENLAIYLLRRYFQIRCHVITKLERPIQVVEKLNVETISNVHLFHHA